MYSSLAPTPWNPFGRIIAFFCQTVDVFKRFYQRFQVGKLYHCWAIRGGVVRVLMGFHEDACHAHGGGGARKRGHEAALTPRCRSLAAGLLNAVGGIEDDRVAGFRHDGQAAEVGDQRIIAKGGTALGQQDL